MTELAATQKIRAKKYATTLAKDWADTIRTMSHQDRQVSIVRNRHLVSFYEKGCTIPERTITFHNADNARMFCDLVNCLVKLRGVIPRTVEETWNASVY